MTAAVILVHILGHGFSFIAARLQHYKQVHVIDSMSHTSAFSDFYEMIQRRRLNVFFV